MKLATTIAVLFGYVMCMLAGYGVGHRHGRKDALKPSEGTVLIPGETHTIEIKPKITPFTHPETILPDDSTAVEFYIEMERDAMPFKPDTVAADTFEIDLDWRKMEEFCPKHEQFEPLDSLWNRIEPKPVLKV